MTIDILTLFPEYFDSLLQTSILGKALSSQKIKIFVHTLREFGVGKHKLTDDRPYGGGPGMVMMIEPIDRALEHLGYKKDTPQEKIILTSAKGKLFTQETARKWQQLNRLAIICGHYEGVDERVAQHLVDEEVRIGDYVLTGGEPAAAVMIDTVSRLQPGVLGNNESTIGESHDVPGELGHSQYSRPAEYKGWSVPAVLQSGDHQQIAQFRLDQRKK